MESRGPFLSAAGYQGADSVLSMALTRFVEACTPGFGSASTKLEVDVTAHGESAASLFDSVDGGHRQVAYIASGYLSARVAELKILDLPFSIDERAPALNALDHEAGALLRVAVRDKTGMHVLGFWDNGFRHVTNGCRPIRSPADCEGLKIRTLNSEIYRTSLEAIGFTAMTTDVKELQRAVATRAVDAQENPLTNFVNFGLWRDHPFVSLTKHFFGVLLFVCNARWFEALPAELRLRIERAAQEATALQRRLAAAEDEKALAFLAANGVEVIASHDIDRAAMRSLCAPVVDATLRAASPALLKAYLGR